MSHPGAPHQASVRPRPSKYPRLEDMQEASRLVTPPQARQRFVPKMGTATALPPAPAGIAMSTPRASPRPAQCQMPRPPPPPPLEVIDEDDEPEMEDLMPPPDMHQTPPSTEQPIFQQATPSNQASRQPEPARVPPPQARPQPQPRRQQPAQRPAQQPQRQQVLQQPEARRSPSNLFEWFLENKVNCALRVAVELCDRHFEHLSFLVLKGHDEEITKMLDAYANHYNIYPVFE